jgi:NAD(P)-dependent dehydrogenase (short-subunit alcohol dehydrogenase family)
MTYGYDLPAGSVAFVTGAASGLGAMSALVLAEAGCSNLVLVDVSADGLAETAKQTGLKEENLLVKAMDLRKDAEVAALFGEIESRFGRLDYAVCVG